MQCWKFRLARGADFPRRNFEGMGTRRFHCGLYRLGRLGLGRLTALSGVRRGLKKEWSDRQSRDCLVACRYRPIGVAQWKGAPKEPACPARDKLPLVGIQYEMALPFQDVEYFRSGLKFLFVAPALGLF
jgi:hypothetical protein